MSERFDKFTKDSQKILETAQVVARVFGQTHDIDAVHLAQSCLINVEIASCLRDSGINLDLAITNLGLRAGPVIYTGADIGLTIGAKNSLKSSVEESIAMGDSLIRPIHLMLGIIDADPGIAADLFVSQGVLEDKFRNRARLLNLGQIADEAKRTRILNAAKESHRFLLDKNIPDGRKMLLVEAIERAIDLRYLPGEREA